jgi:hypothetical protein
MKKYFNGFECVDDVKASFADQDGDYKAVLNSVDLKDEEVLFASYGGGDYDGDAFVVFVRDGKLYEVHGSHCSCNGLEGQWSPEETSVAALEMRVRNAGSYMANDHGEEAFEAIIKNVISELFEKEVLVN